MGMRGGTIYSMKDFVHAKTTAYAAMHLVRMQKTQSTTHRSLHIRRSLIIRRQDGTAHQTTVCQKPKCRWSVNRVIAAERPPQPEVVDDHMEEDDPGAQVEENDAEWNAMAIANIAGAENIEAEVFADLVKSYTLRNK